MRARYHYRPGHPKANANGFVSSEDLGNYGEAERAWVAPIMVDRFYENTVAPDGTDIGSRRKHREYMKANNLTTVDDYTQQWQKDAAHREKIATGEADKKERREELGRVAYEYSKRRR